MMNTVGIVNTEDEHCRFIEVLDRFIKSGHSFNILKCAADSIVDNAVVAESDVNIGSHVSKNRRKKCTAGNKLY